MWFRLRVSLSALCFVYNVAHSDTKLTVDGCLSLEKLSKVDSAWAQAIREGLEWLVVSHSVVEKFPEYTLLTAGSASGQIAAVENELQLAKKLSSAFCFSFAEIWQKPSLLPGCV